MNFFEEYNRILNSKSNKIKKQQKQANSAIWIALTATVIEVIVFNMFFIKLNIIISIIAGIMLFLLIYTVLVLIIILSGTNIIKDIDEKEELGKKYYKDVCEVLLQEHGYSNINTQKISIQDKEVGLMSGDQYKELIVGITCDQFRYNKIRYYHVHVYKDADGYETREEKTSFMGFEIFIPYNTGIDQTVRIIPSIMKNNQEKVYTVMSSGKLDEEEHIDIEDIEFNEKFEVYSKDAHSAYYFLSSKRIEYLKQLRRSSLISVAVNKDGLYIATNRNTKLLEPPEVNEKEDISKERFEKEFSEFERFIGEYKKIIEL